MWLTVVNFDVRDGWGMLVDIWSDLDSHRGGVHVTLYIRNPELIAFA